MFAHQELSDRQLRYFGASLSALFLAFAAIAYWKWDSQNVASVLIGFATALAVVYYALPQSRRPIYRSFRKATYPIQLVMTMLILAIVFFVVLTPIGLLLRLKGATVRTKPDGSETYWHPHSKTTDKTRYFDTY